MNTYVYRFCYLPFRFLACKIGLHDFECESVGPDYAQLYCFYCDRGRKSYVLQSAKKGDEYQAMKRLPDEVSKIVERISH